MVSVTPTGWVFFGILTRETDGRKYRLSLPPDAAYKMIDCKTGIAFFNNGGPTDPEVRERFRHMVAVEVVPNGKT